LILNKEIVILSPYSSAFVDEPCLSAKSTSRIIEELADLLLSSRHLT
jgi:hypothetical protein